MEARKKMSETHKANPNSNAFKKGHKNSAETEKKRSEFLKRYYAKKRLEKERNSKC
jgi:hypothetical protein